MSNTLAIGAVTAALQQMLGDVATPLPGDPNPDPDLADAFVTCKALDIARAADEKKNQLNLFLFQLSYDAAFRNMDMPGGLHAGESGQQPLALCLYYVLTAYGAGDDDVKAHRMLGRAMSILHDNSTIPRATIQAALSGNDLWQQIERVRVRPHPLGTEEISKLWTGFSKPYRISIGYEVTVVLIESTKPAIAGIPVLTRGKPVGGVEPGPHIVPNLDLPYPVLDSFECPKKRPSAQLGETITIRGSNLGGTPLVIHFDHRLFTKDVAKQHDQPPTGTRDATSFKVQIPNDATSWPPGAYTVTVDVTSDQLRTTNALTLPLAPQITAITKVTSTPTLLVLSIGCTPQVWADQKASLIVGDQQVLADPHGQTGTLQFTVQNPPAGLTYLRLRVDGIDSMLVTDFTITPPVFDPSQAITLP
jgi:hypothetical protein